MMRLFQVVGMVVGLAGTAFAQSVETVAVEQPDAGAAAKTRSRAALHEACQADADRLCTEPVDASGDKQVVRCLVQNKTQLEPVCVDALKRARRVQAFRRHCRSEVKKLCPGVEPGEGRIVACLKENAAQVSKRCKDRWARREAKKGPGDVASVADEAITEEQAGTPPIEAELEPLPEETPVPPPGGDDADQPVGEGLAQGS